ncbi:MAG: alpha/beta hydrolase [Chloroflexi bacterium]|nr:alpha/beta hydrolase [Chloroflexota bacterium]
MSALIVDGQMVHYEVLGRGPALVFVHGWLGSWRYWVPTMQTLSSRYRTYAVDLWGFGDSAKQHERYTLEEQTALLRHFMEQLGIPKAAFVGHALGGAIVLRFADEHPEMVARLMAVSVPLVGAALNPRFAGATPPILLDWLMGRNPTAEQIAVEANKADVAAIDTSVRAVMELDLRVELTRTGVPCLLVHSERDPAVAAPQESWFDGVEANFHQITFEESRHFPMLEEVAKFNRLLLDFLESDDLKSLQLKEEWRRRIR